MARKESLALALALACTSAWAQDQRPLPQGSPDALVSSAVRVHLYADEALPPDALRALARPQVILWLSTRSNTLQESTVERLARFDSAWVRLKAPLSKVDARVLARVPQAGVWVTAADLPGVVGRAPGARRLAVELQGPLSAPVAEAVALARPTQVRWRPEGPIDLLAFSLFRALPGQKVLVPVPTELFPTQCGERRSSEPALELHVATLLAMSSDVFPCGQGTRVVVGGEAERWLLQSLVVRDPSIELVVEVGADPERASRASILLDRLGLGPSR